MKNKIDSLFGSKTRVKLLGLFMTSPEENFYVREITRLIDEQVNSVRRELNNLYDLGVVNSSTEDRKVFYKANRAYKYFTPLRAIFAGVEISEEGKGADLSYSGEIDWKKRVSPIRERVDIFVVSQGDIEALIVGDNSGGEISKWCQGVESDLGRDFNYVILTMEDFFYRYSTRDMFISRIFDAGYSIIIDEEDILRR